jgi:hypothetical protein
MDAKLEGVNQVVADMLEDQGIEVVRWVPKNALLIKEELAQIVQMITTTEE